MKNIFHICNRGVDKRKIFLGDKDYLRFTHNLYDFNDQSCVSVSYNRRRLKNDPPDILCRAEGTEQRQRQRELLVDILTWTLMQNHFHLLVQERIDGGAGEFIRKTEIGFTKYFNIKNERSGVLFQGKAKIIPLTKDEHFLHIPFYILSNVVEYLEPEWKEKGIKNFKRIVEFLENYKWSGLSDLIGKDNFPLLINKKLFYELFDTDEKRFKKEFLEWLNDYKGGFDNFEF